MKREFLAELENRINISTKLIEILKEIKNEPNELDDYVKNMINNNLNKDNLLDFYNYVLQTTSLGEFYTPQELGQLTYLLLGSPKNETIYEPTFGAGTLIDVFYKNNNKIKAQEINHESIEVSKLIYGDLLEIKLGDTLINDQFPNIKFKYIISNPPYGIQVDIDSMETKMWKSEEPNKTQTLDLFEEFQYYELPKKAAESFFIQHNTLKKLEDGGTSINILPHGVLFRGAKELNLRKKLLQENYIDAVIGMPANLFANTTIPVVIIIYKKGRTNKDVLFIDASKEFTKIKTQNKLSQDNIIKIVETYKERKEIKKYSHLATLKEIEENDFNLNIPRYVDTFEEEEEINIVEVSKKMKELEAEILEIEKEIDIQIDDLIVVDGKDADFLEFQKNRGKL